MEAWVVWLVLAALLALAELVTLTFALGLLAVAGMAAGAAGAAGLPLAAQAVVFAIASGAGLAVIRPVALRHVRRSPPLRTGVSALVGREAVTLTEVSRHGGRAKIGGEEWTARPYLTDDVIPAGATVDVFAIEGVTALVHPREMPS